MRGAEHDIEGIGVGRDDGGHCADHVVDALFRRQQAEGQQDRSARQAERGLGRIWIDIRTIGHTVRNDAHRAWIGGVAAQQ